MRYKNSDLTATEKEVLHLISDEFLTLKQIQIRRDCSFQAVYKILKRIKEKGFLDNGLNRIKLSQGSNPNDVRLHGQEFNIKLISQTNKYQKELKKSNILFIDGNTIKLYRNSIEVHSGQSFLGKSAAESENKSLDYFKGLFARLEHELGIIILKQRSRNIKLVNQHYARGESEIANNSIENKDKIRVFAYEDDKLAFITDNSFGFQEDETVHPVTAKPDRIAVDKQVNDWRLNNPPTNSETWKLSSQNTEQINILATTMNNYGTHIKSHTESIIALSKAIPQLVKLLKDTQKENQQLKQRRLSEW
jgi:hypothetical protein